MMVNEIEIRKTFELIVKGGFTEVRVIGGGKTYSGYFASVDSLLKELNKFPVENVYFVLNSIDMACYDRKQQECFLSGQVEATKDGDIIRRDWMLVDIDSKRSSGVSATEEEKKFAVSVGRAVYRFLRDVGFCPPLVCDSGNGMHLLYRIALKNSAENTQLICNVLKLLDIYFSTEKAQADTVVYNASRITKLYGTVAKKGRDTKDRPHRMSKIIVIPDEIKPTPVELLQRVADMLPKPEEKTYRNNYNTENFDLDNFISRHNISVTDKFDFSGGVKYVLTQCLFNDAHKGRDAAIFKLNSGAIAYKCFHNSCSNRTWQDVRVMFEPTAYDRNPQEYSNHRSVQAQPQSQAKYVAQSETNEKGKKFKTLPEIQKRDRSGIITIQSGIEALDRRIIGFNLKELSVWSGSGGSGKSSLLNQICIYAAQQGFSSVIYSAELDDTRLKQWLQLQAAGRQFVKPTKYENYFYVPDPIGEKIDRWLSDKIFIYNNEYGSNIVQLLADIKEHMSKKKTDMVVIDNVMTLETDDFGGDIFFQQKKAIKMLVDFAIAQNVHIHLVAHPRKSTAFLRKEDISGSSALTDMAYNVFIIHRVTQDFIKRSGEHLGVSEASNWTNFKNVIEVCKNRDLGVMGEMFGLHYEIESKRFLNSAFDNPVYGWLDIKADGETKTVNVPVEKDFFDLELITGPIPF